MAQGGGPDGSKAEAALSVIEKAMAALEFAHVRHPDTRTRAYPESRAGGACF